MRLIRQTARRLDVRNGDWVWIESRRGKIKQRAKITDGIDPRVVNVEFGWWYPERHEDDDGVWESNADVLTDMEPPYDPAMGTYQLRALLCRLEKVKPDADQQSVHHRLSGAAASADTRRRARPAAPSRR